MTTATELYADFQIEDALWRAGGGTQARARDAYQAWFRKACAEGNPPDTLRHRVADEAERFFARTIPGPDGHTYWDGPLDHRRFLRNDGHKRHPRYWWWEHVNGPLPLRGHVSPCCGEPNCITPDHQVFVSWSEFKRRYTDEQIIGALQVAALRLGHTPTRKDWTTLNFQPSWSMVARRFSSWSRAISAAGLEPHTPDYGRLSAADAIACIQSVVTRLGRVPTVAEWDHNHERPNRKTLVRIFGGYTKALRAAGVTDKRAPKRDWTKESALEQLHAAQATLGRTPTVTSWERGGNRPNRKTLVRLFGSWSAAIAALKADAVSVEDTQAHRELGS